MTPFATPLHAFPMAIRLFHTLYLLAFTAANVCAQSQTFFPGSVPLAAKTTYLGAYVGISDQSNFARTWPVYPSNPVRCIATRDVRVLIILQQEIVGWAGMVRIDGSNSTYGWLGTVGTNPATVLGLIVTPTRTIWQMRAGTVDLNITFLSPIEVRI